MTTTTKKRYGEEAGVQHQDKNRSCANTPESRRAAKDAQETMEHGEPEDMKRAERRGREPAKK